MSVHKSKMPFRLLCISILGVAALIGLFAMSNAVLFFFGGNEEYAGRFFKSITLFLTGTSFSFAIPYLVSFFIKKAQKVLKAGGDSGTIAASISNDKSLSGIMTASYIALIIVFLLFTWFSYSVWNSGGG